MRIPFMRRMFSRFRSTAQLAHDSAKDIHDIKERMKEQYHIWYEIMQTLRHISEIERDLPKGERHKVMQRVYDRVDYLNESAKILDRNMKNLRRHVESILHAAEKERKAQGQMQKAETANRLEQREARRIAKLERQRKKHEKRKDRHLEKADREREA